MTDDDKPDAELRDQAVAAVRRLDALGLNRGSTGNLSLRCLLYTSPSPRD